MKLQPIIVTIHLLLGMSLLAMLTWLGARQKEHPPVAHAACALRTPALIALCLLALQIALGGWVSTNYAALACSDFPLCHGMLIPKMDFEHGFTLWRALGKTADGDYLPFDALTAIHWAHRMFAFVVAGFIGWVGWRAYRLDGLRTTARAVLGALVLQIAIGIATVRSEEHTSELQSLMRISYAVFCLKKKTHKPLSSRTMVMHEYTLQTIITNKLAPF